MARIKIVKDGMTLLDVPVEFLVWQLIFHGKTQLTPPYTLHTTIDAIGGAVTETQEVEPEPEPDHTGARRGPCPGCDSLDGCQFSA